VIEQRDDREDIPPEPRSGRFRLWVVTRSVLQAASLVAGATQHEDLCLATQALVIAGDLAADLPGNHS
jgi:hypothetical protein